MSVLSGLNLSVDVLTGLLDSSFKVATDSGESCVQKSSSCGDCVLDIVGIEDSLLFNIFAVSFYLVS